MFKYLKFRWHIRKFTKRNKLDSWGNKIEVSAEMLYQLFLADYPQYRNEHSTEYFIAVSTNYIKHAETIDYLLISEKSPITVPPEPTKYFVPLPPGFDEL